MNKPPIKAFKKVRKYCKKKVGCGGCPLSDTTPYGTVQCTITPCDWKIKKPHSKG